MLEGIHMEHAHTPRGADCRRPARRCSSALSLLLLLPIAGLLTGCSGGAGTGTWDGAQSASGTTSNSLNLAWDAVTVVPPVAGYKVYYGTNSGGYTQSISVGNVTTYTVMGLSNQTTYFIAVTAVDGSGDESPFSNEVSRLIP